MSMTEKEIQARVRVKEIKKFYTDLTLYISINLGLILIWSVSGGGYFWPIWVIVGWGIGLFLEALSLNMVPTLSAMLPFLKKEWEEQQFHKIMAADASQSQVYSQVPQPQQQTQPVQTQAQPQAPVYSEPHSSPLPSSLVVPASPFSTPEVNVSLPNVVIPDTTLVKASKKKTTIPKS